MSRSQNAALKWKRARRSDLAPEGTKYVADTSDKNDPDEGGRELYLIEGDDGSWTLDVMDHTHGHTHTYGVEIPKTTSVAEAKRHAEKVAQRNPGSRDEGMTYGEIKRGLREAGSMVDAGDVAGADKKIRSMVGKGMTQADITANLSAKQLQKLRTHSRKKNSSKRRRKKNPAWLVPAAIVAGTVVVAGGSYAGYRAWKKWKSQFEPNTLPPEPEPKDDESWRQKANIDKAMPKPSDFPMGWTVESPGFYGRTDYSDEPGAEPDYVFSYQVLALKVPSDKCSPQPCRYVAVVAGRTEYNDYIEGWVPTRTRDAAHEEIDKQHRWLLGD